MPNCLIFCVVEFLERNDSLVLLFCVLQAHLGSAVLRPRTRFSSSQLREKVLESSVRYSNDWAVQIQDSNLQTINTIASSHGFINMGQIGNLEGYYHFQLNVSHESHRGRTLKHLKSRSIGSLSQIRKSPDLTTALEQHEKVGYVKQQTLWSRVPKDYHPPTDPNWNNQWSLLNSGSITHGPAGKDLNVEPAWIQNITGSGVVVAIVDNGVEKRHRDLTRNFDSRASYDYAHYDSDPTPDNYYGDDPDSHGTECAGVIGMAKSNQYCGVGVAYNARIGGIKFDMGNGNDATEASILSYHSDYVHVYSNSWGPGDLGFIVSKPDELAMQTLERETAQGRGGKGSIYVWAAGNGGTYHDSCAADGYSSSIYTISVGSADQTGRQADYDESCPGKMAVTFSYNSNTFPGVDDTWDPYNQVSTTTLSSQCTSDFTGTSASTPLVSATMALVLQANPQLSWRDVQYLIAYTSNQDRLVGGDWVTNGGGLRVSPKFGFGAIDAEALVTRARRWINVPAQQTAEIQPASLNYGTARRNRDTVMSFNVATFSTGISFLEHVVVKMSLSLHDYGVGYDISDFEYELDYTYDDIYEWLESPHPKRGDIKITLTSPQGTTSTLLPYRLYDFINEEGYTNWPFMSVHHWGESPVGTWTLRVTFKSSYGYVRASDVSMIIYGTTTTPQSVSNIPAHCDSACQGTCSGLGSNNCDVCSGLRIAETQQCVGSCPNVTTLYKTYCIAEGSALSSGSNHVTYPSPHSSSSNGITDPSPHSVSSSNDITDPFPHSVSSSDGITDPSPHSASSSDSSSTNRNDLSNGGGSKNNNPTVGGGSGSGSSKNIILGCVFGVLGGVVLLGIIIVLLVVGACARNTLLRPSRNYRFQHLRTNDDRPIPV